jgi:hypothetical protein
MSIIKSIHNVLNHINNKQERTRKAKLPTITRNPQSMIPDFYESVPMRLIENTLAQLSRTDDLNDNSNGTKPLHAHETRLGSWIPEHNGDRKINVGYKPVAAYFAGGSLCLDLRIDFVYARENDDYDHILNTYGTLKQGTGVIVLTMSMDGTVPHWFEQCIALATDDLESETRPACFLLPYAELWLRIVYMKTKDRPGHARYLLQRTPADMLLEALALMQDNDIECATPLIGAQAIAAHSIDDAVKTLSKLRSQAHSNELAELLATETDTEAKED